MNIKTLLVSFILTLSLNDGLANVCESKNASPYLMFSTKTSYFEVFNGSTATDEYGAPGCRKISVWMLARHGSRFPGSDDILVMSERGVEIKNEIVEAYLNDQGSLCQDDFDKFKSWSFNWTEDDGSLLSESGKLEMFQIGQRTRKRFLDDNLNDTHIKFRRTHKERTRQSAESFAEGAFPDIPVEIPTPLNSDPLLRFFDFCTNWINDIDENPDTYQEQKLFGETEVMKQALKDVELKIGFSEELSLPDGLIIYDICRYEQAHQPDNFSVWCNVFQEEHLKVFEYYEELKYWHKNGYGNALNYFMACPLLQDMASTLGTESGKSGTFYFSHSEAVLPFLASLDLFKDDEPLRHDNYNNMLNRHYRTSKIGSFSSNVIFVLLECEDSPNKRLLTFHQEQRIKLPRCDADPCSWDQFVDKYQDIVGCPFNKICGTDDQAKEDTNCGTSNTRTNVFIAMLCMVSFLKL